MQFSLWPIALNSCTGHNIILYWSQISVNCSRKCITDDFCASILYRAKQLPPSPKRTDPILTLSQPSIKSVLAVFSPDYRARGLKRPKREANSSSRLILKLFLYSFHTFTACTGID